MIFKSCECEHGCHFRDAVCLSPFGNFGHKYGQKFPENVLVCKRTHGQTEMLCPDCAADCRAGAADNQFTEDDEK